MQTYKINESISVDVQQGLDTATVVVKVNGLEELTLRVKADYNCEYNVNHPDRVIPSSIYADLEIEKI